VDENAEYRAGVTSLRTAASVNQQAYNSYQVSIRCCCVWVWVWVWVCSGAGGGGRLCVRGVRPLPGGHSLLLLLCVGVGVGVFWGRWGRKVVC